MRIKWTEQLIREEASRCKTFAEFRGNTALYLAARKRGLVAEVSQHLDRGVRKKWTKEECAAEAAKYKTRAEYQRSCSSYQAALKSGWVDDICQHMESPNHESGYWTKDRIKAVARQYSQRSKFKAACPVGYKKALKCGFLDEICAHMQRAHKSWTKEAVIETANNCGSLTEFRRKHNGAMQAAITNGWLDEVLPLLPENLTKKYTTEIGQKFGRWTATSGSGHFVDVVCECGTSGTVLQTDLHKGATQSCGCAGYNTSRAECEMADWLASQGAAIETQVKINGASFDICVPDAKVLIEYNGCYWHSSAVIDRRDYHLKKRLAAEAAGFRLISIWEDEWKFFRPRFESLLARSLGLVNAKSVGARHLELRPVEAYEANAHHKSNHVQTGNTNGFLYLGGFWNGKMIAAATIARKSISGEDVFDLAKYSVRDGFAVPGLLNKVIAHVDRDFGALPWVSYCDRDHFDGKLYLASGFTCVSTTTKLYYTKGTRRFGREQFMRHKLGDVFGINLSDFNGMTEKEICAAHNVYQCFQSGVDKYYRPRRAMI